MGRYTGPSCRLCRQEGMKLFLKGTRCDMAKCAIERGKPAPGMHGGKRRRKISTYAEQLREKQRLRRFYGIMEKQFRIMFQRSQKKKGITSENLLTLLETRLDNIVFRLGFGASRSQARQLVMHGHVLINNRKVDVPSYQVKTGQVVEVRKNEKSRKAVMKNLEGTENREIPPWLSADRQGLKGEVLRMPERGEITIPVNEQLVVELYSK